MLNRALRHSSRIAMACYVHHVTLFYFILKKKKKWFFPSFFWMGGLCVCPLECLCTGARTGYAPLANDESSRPFWLFTLYALCCVCCFAFRVLCVRIFWVFDAPIYLRVESFSTDELKRKNKKRKRERLLDGTGRDWSSSSSSTSPNNPHYRIHQTQKYLFYLHRTHIRLTESNKWRSSFDSRL
jgi:hypothetical protein